MWRSYSDSRQQLRALRTSRNIHFVLPKGVVVSPDMRLHARDLPGNMDDTVNECYLWLPFTAENALHTLAYGAREAFVATKYGYNLSVYEDPAACDAMPDLLVDTKERGLPAELHCILYRNGSGGVSHPGEVYYMALCRVTLGCASVTEDGKKSSEDRRPIHADPRPWQGPSDKEMCFARGLNCLQKEAWKDVNYHSLFVQKGSLGDHRRVVLYDRRRVLPEYLVAYSRRNPADAPADYGDADGAQSPADGDGVGYPTCTPRQYD